MSTDGGRREIQIIGIVGVGAMGAGIAQIAAQAGLTVRLFDTRPGAAAGAVAKLVDLWAGLVAKGRLGAEAAAAARAKLEPAEALSDLADADLVVEAIVENLEAKRALFAGLEGIVRADCVLATNTSSLSVTAIAAAVATPERVAGYHFFNPVALMKVVEVISGALTAPWVGPALADLARRMGHRPVACIDSPGFIVNHAGRGFGTEALRIAVTETAAGFVDIDRTLRDQVGFRMGPFELLDLTGLDVSQPVMESIYRQFHDEPRFRPSWLLRQRLDAGLLGRKSGRGFYTYANGKPELPPEPPAPTTRPRPVWLWAADPAWIAPLERLIDAAGWPRDVGARPAADSLCLLAPLGDDATTASILADVDASQAVAVDLLFGLERRRVIMPTPATTADALDAAHALMAVDGTPVTRIDDSPGFVSQRVVATIVNIACDIAQQGIATPEDIEAGVTLGLGYPKGPLALGDAVGPDRILAILTELVAATGDPRYRPSLWLSRRAALRMSLLTG